MAETGEAVIVWRDEAKGNGKLLESWVDPATGEVRNGPRPKELHEVCEAKIANLNRSLRRAKKELRLFIVKNHLRRMWTLTFARETRREDRAWVIAQVNDAMQRLRRFWGRDFPYAYVLEWHPKGGDESHGWHVHLALEATFLDKHRFQELWGNGIVQYSDGNGWLKGKGRGGHVSEREQCRRTAHYLAKYLGKTFGTFPPGVRRYETAQGFSVERVTASFRTLSDAMVWLMGQHRGESIEALWQSSEDDEWEGPPVWCVRFT